MSDAVARERERLDRSERELRRFEIALRAQAARLQDERQVSISVDVRRKGAITVPTHALHGHKSGYSETIVLEH